MVNSLGILEKTMRIALELLELTALYLAVFAVVIGTPLVLAWLMGPVQ